MVRSLFHKKPYLVWQDKDTNAKIVVFRTWYENLLFGNHIHESEHDYFFEKLGCAIDLTEISTNLK